MVNFDTQYTKISIIQIITQAIKKLCLKMMMMLIMNP